MLWRALKAYDGALPYDHVVTFANTGKEREETLRFVHECGTRWNVPIVWLEFVSRSGPTEGRYERVSFNSASRDGTPFARLIKAKSYTPNSMMRFCTEELKVNAIKYFVQTELGWKSWANVIGLRHDEGHRVFKALARNDEAKSPWISKMPLAAAKVTKADVAAFWDKQDFDLGLKSYEGNCDLCFLKGRGKLKTLIRENPESADWWMAQEIVGNGSFNKDFSYADLAQEVDDQPHLFDFDDGVDRPDDDHDAECGLWCGEAA
jgi:3'-phosphoadenosine 5'-phosphosulfate sulfotransferase (PAPS reductase)/FAD synthetase